jgi:hypothetical protein
MRRGRDHCHQQFLVAKASGDSKINRANCIAFSPWNSREHRDALEYLTDEARPVRQISGNFAKFQAGWAESLK